MGERKNKWRQRLQKLGLLMTGLLLLSGLGKLPFHAFAEDAVPSTVDAAVVDYEAALTDLQTALSFQGEPLNPRAVAALTPWLSDRLPGAIAVDVEGTTADTNQFSAEVFADEAGRVTAEWEQRGELRFAGYQPIGPLSDGTQVLRTFINTGGNAVFPSLVLVSFNLDDEMWWDGMPRQRLSMVRRGEFLLGAGYSGDITVHNQTITMTPGPHGEASVTVEIPPQGI